MSSTNNNRYEKQKERAIKRKLEFIQMFGGCCQKCGYKKNLAALNFHHKNPKQKFTKLDARKLANCKYEILLEEIKKCELLCGNCHVEAHSSEYLPKM